MPFLRLDAPSRRRLLQLHRRDALYYMHFGDREAARDALLLSQRLSPSDADIAHMLQSWMSDNRRRIAKRWV